MRAVGSHRRAALGARGCAVVARDVSKAHIQVSPTEAAPGDPVKFELLIPGETDAHTTEVALQIPKGVLPFSFEDQPGWKRTIEQARRRQRRRRALARPAGERRVRPLRLPRRTPKQEGDLAWKAVQRYDDGEEAAWIGAADSDNPAAVTTISASAPRQNAGGEGAEAEEGAAAPGRRRRRRAARAVASDDDDGDDPLPLILGAGGLVLGAAALAVALRRRPREATPEPPASPPRRWRRCSRSPRPRARHEGNPNYLSQSTRSHRPPQGVTVDVLNRDDRLLLHNTSGEDVVIEGYDDEPYARLRADGRSRSTRLGGLLPQRRPLRARRRAGRRGRQGRRALEGGRADRALRVARPPVPLDVADDAAAGRATSPSARRSSTGRSRSRSAASAGAIAGTLFWTPLPGGGPPLAAIFGFAGFVIALLRAVVRRPPPAARGAGAAGRGGGLVIRRLRRALALARSARRSPPGRRRRTRCWRRPRPSAAPRSSAAPRAGGAPLQRAGRDRVRRRARLRRPGPGRSTTATRSAPAGATARSPSG